jgi:hypothetical protein
LLQPPGCGFHFFRLCGGQVVFLLRVITQIMILLKNPLFFAERGEAGKVSNIFTR